MSEKIVVAVDRETGHRAPLDWAVRRALRTGASVELVLIIQRTWGDREPAPDRLLVAAAQAALDSHADYARRREVTVSMRWAYGHVADELDVASRGADLLVVGTHRMREPDHAFAGSLGLRVAVMATCPVVLVPHDWADDGEGVAVGLDGRLRSEAALEFAAAEAAALGEPLDIVCAGYGANPLFTGLVPEVSVGDRRQQIVDAAAEVVHDRYPQLAVAKRVMEASPANGLVTASRGRRLLVIGSRGRHGAQQVLLGSVGHDVILNLQSPVAVVRSITMGGQRADV
jgi:nucleotide-binding universal stress UspA family protein